MSESQEADKYAPHWFVMRDLKRANAKYPAYKLLKDRNVDVFTPMKWQLTVKGGKRVREEVPFIRDLLFVHSTRENLDPIVARIPTLQYRWRYHTFREPLTVPDDEMTRFIHAVRSSNAPRYYMPEEVTPEMYRRKIHIVGGPLDNYEGYLLTTRGSKVKRLLVELPMFFSVGVEVMPEYIELL